MFGIGTPESGFFMDANAKTSSKARVALEKDKLRQTTHWDMDYLPLETVETLYARNTLEPTETDVPHTASKTQSNRLLGIICILAGLGLLIVVLAAARFMAT